MKLLIANELLRWGGAEIQNLREAQIMAGHGHDVLAVTFDPNFPDGWQPADGFRHFNINSGKSKFLRYALKLLPDKRTERAFRRLVRQFGPDYIHLNNADMHALAIFNVVKDYKCLQTIRDYGAVCPNGMCIRRDYTVCCGAAPGVNCAPCMLRKEHLVRNLWRWLSFRRINPVKRRTIRHYACPSRALTDYCNHHGYETVCIRNSFDFSIQEGAGEWEPPNGEKVFLFYGQIDEHKGILQLIEAFRVFARDKEDARLEIVGILPSAFRDRFERALEWDLRERIQRFDRLPYPEMLKKLRTAYAVVIPSLWLENYPNTALEAMALGRLALASDRGGAREIIGEDRFIFDVLNQADIVSKLETAYGMSAEEYRAIAEANQERVRRENCMELYYERLCRVLDAL